MADISKKIGRVAKIHHGRLDKNSMDKLKAHAEKEDRSINYIINKLIKDYVKELQTQKEKEKDE